MREQTEWIIMMNGKNASQTQDCRKHRDKRCANTSQSQSCNATPIVWMDIVWKFEAITHLKRRSELKSSNASPNQFQLIFFNYLLVRASLHSSSSLALRWPRKQAQAVESDTRKNEEKLSTFSAFSKLGISQQRFWLMTCLLIILCVATAAIAIVAVEKWCGIGHFCDCRCDPNLFDCWQNGGHCSRYAHATINLWIKYKFNRVRKHRRCVGGTMGVNGANREINPFIAMTHHVDGTGVVGVVGFAFDCRPIRDSTSPIFCNRV